MLNPSITNQDPLPDYLRVMATLPPKPQWMSLLALSWRTDVLTTRAIGVSLVVQNTDSAFSPALIIETPKKIYEPSGDGGCRCRTRTASWWGWSSACWRFY